MTHLAWSQFATIESSNDAHGTFSFTLAHSNGPYVYAFSDVPDMGIHIQAFGIQEVLSPDGWKASTGDNSFIWWVYTNGIYYLDNTSVTFTIRSTFTRPTMYSNAFGATYYSKGILIADAATATNHLPKPGGYQFLIHSGPAVPRFSDMRITDGQLILTLMHPAGATSVVEGIGGLNQNEWEEITNFSSPEISTNWSPRDCVSNAWFFWRTSYK